MSARRHQKRNRYLPPSPQKQGEGAGSGPAHPWSLIHPTLEAIRDRLQITTEAWNLLRAPDGACRRKPCLPQGLKEPDPVYESRIKHARPSGFYRDALRTYAGMLSFLHWRALPQTLRQVIADVDGIGTDLAVFLFIADLLVLRGGGCIIVMLPTQISYGSNGEWLEAVGHGDRGSAPRLAQVLRADLLDWRVEPLSRGLLELAIRCDHRRPVQPSHYCTTPVLVVGRLRRQRQRPLCVPAAAVARWTRARQRRSAPPPACWGEPDRAAAPTRHGSESAGPPSDRRRRG